MSPRQMSKETAMRLKQDDSVTFRDDLEWSGTYQVMSRPRVISI